MIDDLVAAIRSAAVGKRVISAGSFISLSESDHASRYAWVVRTRHQLSFQEVEESTHAVHTLAAC